MREYYEEIAQADLELKRRKKEPPNYFVNSLLNDRQVHKYSGTDNRVFLSLQNGILTLHRNGDWEWSERPE